MVQAARAVDYDHLRNQTAGDLGVMREVLALFVTHCEQVLDELERANDEKTWKQWTHTLKGSARGVGAFVLGEAAANAERHPLDKNTLVPLRAAYADAQAYIGANPL